MSATCQLHTSLINFHVFVRTVCFVSNTFQNTQFVHTKTWFIVCLSFEMKTNQYSSILTDAWVDGLINNIPHAYDEQIASYVQAPVLHLFITILTVTS